MVAKLAKRPVGKREVIDSEEKFYVLLEEKRQERKLSVTKLAELLNMSYQSLHAFRHRRAFPSKKLLQRICDYFDFDFPSADRVRREVKARRILEGD